MASSADISSIKVAEGVDGESSDYLGPGACSESILITTDSFEEFANEMSSSLDDSAKLVKSISTISEIQSQIGEVSLKEEPSLKTIKSTDDLESLPEKIDSVAGGSSSSSLQQEENKASQSEKHPDDYINNPEWADKKKHVFVLSSAGKPIYSRYGNEDKLAGLCGVIQALVSVVQNQKEDVLRSIHTQDCKAVFFVKGPLILVSVSKSNESETQLVLQLTYAFNQIVSILTLTQLNRIFEQRRNYDLRRLLSGAERLIDHLLTFMEEDPAFLLGAVRCLPLPPNARDNITSTIISACNKIKDLVFAILLAGNQLITLVRMKKYTLHPSDIHLLINLVRSSESFKTAESWTPICLPKFDATGFLHGHVSYISEDCQACLLLLTVQRDAFFTLSQAKHTISEKLRRTNCLVAINDSLNRKKDLPTTNPLKHIGVPEMRHFIYKSKSAAQLFSSNPIGLERMHSSKKQDVAAEVPKDKKLTRLSDIDYVHKYRTLCSQIHCTGRPAKLIYKMNSDETILAWVTNGFEVYITFDPLMDKNSAIIAVNKLLRWIEKEQEKIFIMGAPTF